MAALTTFTQARALARRLSKGFGQLSGLFDFFGFGFLADVLQAFAVAALLVAFLLTLLMRQVAALTTRLARLLRTFLVRVVTGGGFFAVVLVLLGANAGMSPSQYDKKCLLREEGKWIQAH